MLSALEPYPLFNLRTSHFLRSSDFVRGQCAGDRALRCYAARMQPSIARSGRLMAWLRISGPALARQVAKFGAVGFLAYVVDVTLFNALQYFGAQPLLADEPLRAKAISAAVATVVAWLGNRYWTFRRTRRREMRREFALFVVMCTIGVGISLSILWFSHYVLGLTSPLADNISANVIGLAAGAAFRFWAYRRFVFVHHIRTPGGFAAADRTTTRDDSASLNLNPMVPVRDLSKAPLERVRE